MSIGPLKIVPCTPAAAAWGNITGTLANQVDLAAALAAAKQPPVTVQSLSALLVAAGVAQPITTLAANTPGALYFTLDGINAVTLCVAGTQTPGCPGTPVAAGRFPLVDPAGNPAAARPVYAYSAQDSTGKKPGPAFWVPLESQTASTNPHD